MAEIHYLYLYIGKQFWVFDGHNLVENSPRPLTDLGLSPSVDKVDAAFVWGKNNRAYLFSRDRYWKLTADGRGIESGYPQSISQRWRGIPNDIDAVFTWRNGETYFFKVNSFWRFDDDKVIADVRHDQPVTKYWLGCQS